MRTCILCFNEQFATIGEVQRYLDEVAEVGFWYRCLPNSILLTSSVEPSVLARGLQQRFVPDRLAVTKMFLIAEIQHKFTAGLLPYQAWELIEKPESPKVSKEELVTANYFVSVSHGREGSVEFQKDDKGIDVAEFFLDGQSIGKVPITSKNRGFIESLRDLEKRRTKEIVSEV